MTALWNGTMQHTAMPKFGRSHTCGMLTCTCVQFKKQREIKQGNYVPDMATEETGVKDGGAEVLV